MLAENPGLPGPEAEITLRALNCFFFVMGLVCLINIVIISSSSMIICVWVAFAEHLGVQGLKQDNVAVICWCLQKYQNYQDLKINDTMLLLYLGADRKSRSTRT